MSIVDAHTVDDGTTLSTDLCIIGAGAAGLAVALEMDGRALDVIVLESGGFAQSDESHDDIDVVGAPLNESEPRRRSGYGGTLQSWYGRLARYDPIDFEARSWVPYSGWPITPAEIVACEDRAAQFFGLASRTALDDTGWSNDPTLPLFANPMLDPGMHVWPSEVRTHELHRMRIRESRNLRLFVHAQAHRLVADDEGSTVGAVMVRGPQGRRFRIQARAYVLACGGWENARLLLLSRDRHGVALGNRHDNVGRFYLNHPRLDGAAKVMLHRPQAARLAGLLCERQRPTRSQLCLRLSPQVQRSEQVLNACSFFYPVPHPRIAELARALDQFPAAGSLRRVISEFPLLARAAVGRWLQRPLMVEHLAVVDQVEQVPDPSSRIRSSERCDRFGDPVLQLDWKIDQRSTEAIRRLHHAIAQRLSAAGIGTLQSSLFDLDFRPSFMDAAHPMGTTRMSDDRRLGVVDRCCRLHDTRNLFVAGSSVFPTSGQGPPTWTLVCLALRLADHLRLTVLRE